jgi:hypothetical protein
VNQKCNIFGHLALLTIIYIIHVRDSDFIGSIPFDRKGLNGGNNQHPLMPSFKTKNQG